MGYEDIVQDNSSSGGFQDTKILLETFTGSLINITADYKVVMITNKTNLSESITFSGTNPITVLGNNCEIGDKLEILLIK